MESKCQHDVILWHRKNSNIKLITVSQAHEVHTLIAHLLSVPRQNISLASRAHSLHLDVI